MVGSEETAGTPTEEIVQTKTQQAQPEVQSTKLTPEEAKKKGVVQKLIEKVRSL